jgi:ABC-2 type transport system ATP-binding protein
VAGFVEGPRFYPYLTGRRNLQLLADYDEPSSRSRIEEVLETVELRDRAKDRVGGYSHGMRQRLGIAASLLRQPQLLLLDEPATGLDPAGMRDMRDLIKRLALDGITILLSSHLLYEVEELCNRVAIIAHGVIIKESKLADLLAAAGGHYELEVEDANHALTILRANGVNDVTTAGRILSFTADRADVARISIALGRAGVGIYTLSSESTSLERLFLSLTEGEKVDGPALVAVEDVA